MKNKPPKKYAMTVCNREIRKNCNDLLKYKKGKGKQRELSLSCWPFSSAGLACRPVCPDILLYTAVLKKRGGELLISLSSQEKSRFEGVMWGILKLFENLKKLTRRYEKIFTSSSCSVACEVFSDSLQSSGVKEICRNRTRAKVPRLASDHPSVARRQNGKHGILIAALFYTRYRNVQGSILYCSSWLYFWIWSTVCCLCY